VRSVDVPAAKTYQQPISSRLVFRALKTLMVRRSGEFWGLIFHWRSKPNIEPQGRKAYEPPKLRHLTLEQAKLILIGHASITDQDTKELMDLVFPEPSPRKSSSGAKGAKSEVGQCGGSVLGETSGLYQPEEGGSIPTPPPQF